MNQLDPNIVNMLHDEIIQRIIELLEKKHLYQYVRIDTTNVEKLIDDVKESAVKEFKERRKASRVLGEHPGAVSRSPEVIIKDYVQRRQQGMRHTTDFIMASPWSFTTDVFNQPLAVSDMRHTSEEATHFVLPTVSVLCKKCDSIQPHNSGFRGQTQEFQAVSKTINKEGIQVPVQTFVFPYECQKCKEEPLLFLVHREGSKLKLVGRNHFEKVQVPKTIPSEEKEYFSDAVVAYNTGNVLAGLFLLRTTIEQYMRRILEITDRKTGDELANEYAALLHDEFPQSYPSMKTIYEELSIVLHNADANSTQFEKSKKDIENHFELLKFHPLKDRSGGTKNKRKKRG